MTRARRSAGGSRPASDDRFPGRRLAALAALALAATLLACGGGGTDRGGMEDGMADEGMMDEGMTDERMMDEGTMDGGMMDVDTATAGMSDAGMRTTSSTGVPPKPAFDAAGELERPEGYREWIFVGTPLTPNELNPPEAPFPEFHNVYIHPADWAHWRRTGEFRDGTVLIKELVSIGSKTAASGNGYFMGEFIGLEATVKDSRRFPDEPGHWAYFSFGHAYPLAETASLQPVEACNACHAGSAEDDWVFTQYYPVLRAAKGGSGR